MMTRMENKQIKFHMVTIENLVPEKHFLRRLEQRVDFTFIYEETKSGYCPNNGRPSVDPVVLVKYLLIGFLHGIPSERRIEQKIQVNMAYRWFWGLDMDERVRIIPPSLKTEDGGFGEKPYSSGCLSGFGSNALKMAWWKEP